MGLPGEGVEHAPDGDAGEDAVVTPEAHVDHLEGRGHCQGCGTRCGVSGWFWVTAQRHLVAGAGTQGGLIPAVPPDTRYSYPSKEPLQMVSGLWKPSMGREQWFPSCFSKILHRCMATSRVAGRARP